MDLNYIISAHEQPTLLKRLVLRLSDENSFFYIHIDKKVDIEPFKRELSGLKNVTFLEKRVEVIWADISQVDANLIGMQKVIEDQRDGYCIVMSGVDYPIKPKAFIRNYFETNKGKNFITLRPVEEKWPDHYEDRINKYNFHIFKYNRKSVILPYIKSPNFFVKRNFKAIKRLLLRPKYIHLLKLIFTERVHPKEIRPYGGSALWALPMETIYLIIKFLEENKAFKEYHKYSGMPDEILFHSIIAHLKKAEDIQDNLTYTNWTRQNCTLPVVFQSLDDFNELQKTDSLFARKFIDNTDLLDKIDKELLNISSTQNNV